MKLTTSLAVGCYILGALLIIGVMLHRADNQRIDNYAVHHQCVEVQRTERTNMRVYRCDTGLKTELDMINESKEPK